MKIIGQSSIVTTPPYVHLGYLATTIVEYSNPPIGAGLGLVALGVVLAFRFKRIGAGWWNGTRLALRRPIGWSILGLVTIIASMSAVAYRTAWDTGIYADPERLTQSYLIHLYQILLTQTAEGAPLPDAIQAVEQDYPNLFQDAWRSKLKIEPLTLDGVDAVRVISAGPDTWFGTADDMVYPN